MKETGLFGAKVVSFIALTARHIKRLVAGMRRQAIMTVVGKVLTQAVRIHWNAGSACLPALGKNAVMMAVAGCAAPVRKDTPATTAFVNACLSVKVRSVDRTVVVAHAHLVVRTVRSASNGTAARQTARVRNVETMAVAAYAASATRVRFVLKGFAAGRTAKVKNVATMDAEARAGHVVQMRPARMDSASQYACRIALAKNVVMMGVAAHAGHAGRMRHA